MAPKCCVKTGYVHRNGVKLFYRIRGKREKSDQPVMVFVHGEASDSRVWTCQQKAFCHLYQTIAIDLRGFGKSSKVGPLTMETHREDLYYLLNELNLLSNGIILTGWSAGGLVVQAYVIAYPQTVVKLVLVDTGPQVISTPEFPYGRSAEEEAEILYYIKNDFPQYVIRGSEAAIPETCEGAAEIRKQIALQIVASGKEFVLRQTLDAALFSSVKELSSITTPTQIFVGLQDTVINPKASVYLNLHLPNSTMFQFPDAGHAPFLTFQKMFNRKLYQFITDATIPCQICHAWLDEL
jgi:pimeloyl-ACP methyl ester carboxylesterase